MSCSRNSTGTAPSWPAISSSARSRRLPRSESSAPSPSRLGPCCRSASSSAARTAISTPRNAPRSATPVTRWASTLPSSTCSEDLLAPGRPVHSPSERLVQGDLAAVDVPHLALEDQITAGLDELRDGAHPGCGAGVVQSNLDLLASGGRQSDHPVYRRPVRCSLIDHREDQYPAEPARLVEVDRHVLATGDAARAIVAVEEDPRRRVQRTERTAERLHHAFA